MGAACAAGTIYISDNKEVGLTHNKIDASLTTNSNFSEARGGAIKANNLFICDNETVFLKDNGILTIRAEYLQGGAVYITDSLSIRNNRYVCFESNYEQDSKNDIIYLRGLYVKNGNVLLSAPDNGAIEFKDSIYISSGAENKLDINSQYCNSQNEIFSQTGDIVFSSVNTENELYRIKGNIAGLPNEIEKSKTYCAYVQTNLYDGRLRIEDGAIFVGNGITVHSSASGESTPTLYLRNAKLNHSGYDIKLSEGSVIEISNRNSATAAKLIMEAKSSATFYVTGENFYYSNLLLTGSFEQQGALTLNISFNDVTAEAGLYKLMTVTSIADESLWTSSNVTVNGLDGYVVTFDDLEWKDNTLYLNYDGTPGTGGSGSTTPPSLLIATWTNEAQDGMWNSTSLNWEQEDVDYAYVDGVQVVFGDEGAGTVTLVGDIAPSSVLVDSAEDYTWNADETEGGKLTGDMTLTKKGEGKLTINSENDYTGGTSILGGTVVAGSATALGDGAVNLTNATLKIAAEGVSNALTTAGTSSILVQDGGSLTLNAAISNAAAGVLTLSGKVDVSGIGELTKLDATLIDVNDNAGESGFTRAEGYSLQVVQGGKVLGSGAELVHSDLPTGLTLVLGENGLATAGAATDFTKYVVAGSHAVSVSEILKDVPTDSTLSAIEITGGTLLVDAATDVLAATGGTVTVNKAVTLGGTMSGGMLMAQAGEIAATLSGNTAVVVSGGVTLSGSNTHSGGVMLNGGALTLKHAQALGSGQLVTSGTGSLVIGTGVELALGQAISNSGSLSISGKIHATGALNTEAATRVDVNGNSGASGFAKDALEWVQIVNGGTTVNAGAEISHNSATNALVLGSDGRAIGGGVIHHDKYLLTGTGVADVQRIMNAAGSELTSIKMQGGTLTVNADTAALLEATDGIIMLETGGTIGSGSSVSGVDIKASGGSIAATLNGSNTLEGIGNFALDAVIANDGTLVLSGNIKADALSLVEETPSTFVDVNGNSGKSGFSKSAQMSVQLTSGTGTTIDGGVTLTHKDATETLVLGKDGKAGYGGVIDYSDYLLNGEHDSASVSDIIADAGDALTSITVQQGTLTVDAVSKPITATGGAVVLDGGVLNGSLADTALTLKNGSLGTVSITGGSVMGVNYLLGGVLQLSGAVSISGSYDASALTLETEAATRIDVSNTSGESGFLQAASYAVQVFNGGVLIVADGTTVTHGSHNLVLGSDGVATAGGGITWSEYLLTGDDTATASAIYDKALAAGYNGAVAITQTGGTLNVTDNAAVCTTAGNIILTNGTLSGTISGATLSVSGGMLAATLSGTNTLSGANKLLNVLDNDGLLNISGSLDVTQLGGLTDHGVTYTKGGSNGFKTSSAYSIRLVENGGTLNSTATIKHGEIDNFVLGQDGVATAAGTTDYKTYFITAGHEATVDVIRGESGNQLTLIDMSGGTLNANADAAVKVTGGAINLTDGTLSGSISGAALSITGGSLTATLSGTNTLSGANKLLNVLDNDGLLNISGSLDVTQLGGLTDHGMTYTKGGSNGFKTSSAYSIRLVENGGTLNSTATIKYGEIDNFVLDSDGVARAEGTTFYDTYYITSGHEATVDVIRGESGNQLTLIDMSGGTLNANADAAVKVTGGAINLTAGTLSGTISGSTINASAGTLAATLNGINTLVGDGYTLNDKLTNSGTLTLSGTFTIGTDLTVQHAEAGYESLSGGYDTTNGFARTEWYSVDIADGVTADANATITYDGKTLKLGNDGVATRGGEVDYTMYYLNSGELNTKSLHDKVAGADITLKGGTLTVETQSTVTATGGAIKLVENGVLNGSLTNTNLTLTAGVVNAGISGGSITGDSYMLNEILQVSGNVSISGSFVADALTLTTIDAKRVDVVEGNSGNSGFLLSDGKSVQIINGGTLDIAAGTSVTHGGINLTLGADGYATTGRTQGHEYLLIGNDAVNVGAILAKDVSATINMQGGTLTVDAATNALTATAGTINLASDVELGGSISGATIYASTGTLAATLNGSNTLVGDDFALEGVLTNNGTLVLNGSFTVSTLTTNDAATFIGADGVSGFAKEAYKVAKIAGGSTIDGGVTITYNGEELKLNTDGTASTGGVVDYSTFWLQSDTRVESDDIHTLGSDALVNITSGYLTVNDETRVNATGGGIELAAGGVLNGSLSNAELTLTAGVVNAGINGGKVIGNGYALSEILQVSGNVCISGSFNASALQLVTEGISRVDVVEGNSGNSGFMKYGDSYVQVINGGVLTIDGATVKHGELNLTLGVDGYARTTGATELGEYLLTGNDKVNVDAVLTQSADAAIFMNGGTLTVDRELSKLTATAGTINLSSDVELGGSISGATIYASTGTLTAALSGNNTLVGDGCVLNGVLNNIGTLMLSGTFTVNSLTTDDAATFIGADGKSGFAKEAYKVAKIAGGSTIDGGVTITYNGEELKLNTDGTASTGGVVDYSTFWLQSDTRVESDDIHTLGSDALVNITSGYLTVNDETRVNATGGGIELAAGGVLNGSLSNAELTLTAGVVNAGINGGKVIGNGYALSEILQVSGNVCISGSFNASALQLVTEGISRVDVVEGNSGNSGFLKYGDSYVQVINGEDLTIVGATVKHGELNLTLGVDGYARSTGATNYSEYLLTGSDRVSTQQIHIGDGAGASVRQDGGMLTVNDETTVKTTSGEIVVSGATLHGEVSDARVTAESGSIAATLGGITAVTITGEVNMSGKNLHTGVTTLADGELTITHANALGSGDVVSTGKSMLVVDSVTLVLGDTITNTGELTLSGSFDASALLLQKTEAGRLSLSGEREGLTESGFSQGVEYSVQLVNGGKSVADGLSIHHDDFLMRTQLVLGEDGVARAGAEVDYTHFFLTGGDSAAVSEIAAVSTRNQAELNGVSMDSGLLTVDQSIIVSATGGSIVLTKTATLGGSIENTAVSSSAGNYSAKISALMSGDSALVVNGGEITVSGANSYTGGTQVNGGALMAGNAKAFGTGDVVVNGATLDLKQFSITNKVVMNGSSTLGYADGASHIVLGSGAAVNFRNGYTLGSGKRLTVAGPVSYTGALTLGGGTLDLDGKLTVQGDVTFESGTLTTLDISGWKGLDDGEVLVDFGSSTSGYTEESLKLSGIAGDWELEFDAATGVLTLVEVKVEPQPEPEFTPNLNRNQQVVYDTMKDIMGEGKPSGLLGQLGKEVTDTRDEAKLKELLDALSGAEYASLMSSQQDAARGHMRRLRGSMGSGYALAGTKTRAYIEAYTNRSDVDGDASGRGYEMTENGGQFALEFLGEDKVSGGFAVASGRSKLQPEVGLTQKSSNTYVDAFLVSRDGAYTGKTSLGVGVHSYDLERQVMGNAVRAQADGSSVNFMHESAYATALDESSSVQFFGAVESSMGKLGAFLEKGADTASLQVKSQDAWMTTLSAGARYHYSFAAVDAAPAATLSLQAGLEYKLGDTESEVEMSFSGARSHTFRQSGSKRDCFGYNVGASLHVPVSARAAVYASGDAVLRGDSSEVNANLGVQLAF